MSAREFVEWSAYEALEPFGEWRADLRMGILASVMASPYRKREAPPLRPADFMPFRDAEEEKKPDSPADLSARIRAALLRRKPT
jgi:Protein of unknown function (DUF4035)